MLDGFQGSANSFARHALLAVNPELRLASHMHNPAHLVVATRVGLPTVLCIRDPLDAVASYLLRDLGQDPAAALVRYAWFHRRVLPHLSGMVVAPFDRIVERFGDVIDEVNERFRCALVRFPHDDPEAAALVEAGMTSYSARTIGAQRAPVPVAERNARLPEMRERLLVSSLELAREECQVLYEAVVSR